MVLPKSKSRNRDDLSKPLLFVGIFVVVFVFLLLLSISVKDSQYIRSEQNLLNLKAPASTTTSAAENNDSAFRGVGEEEEENNEIIAESSSQEEAQNKKAHHCLNDDFRPHHKVGVWTMLNDNSPTLPYVRGGVKLGRGAKTHTKTPIDLVVMELESQPLSDLAWKMLSDVGYQRCVVSSIPPPPGVKTRGDLTQKFAVLHVWAMEVYDTVLFLDADTFVLNKGLDALIHTDLGGKPLGVTKDIRNRKWVDTFNSGVMKIHPSQAEHHRLLNLLNSGIKFEYIMSDQGFLNEVYKDNWHEIGFVNNANLALYKFQREFWDEHKIEDINVIHYTMQKPWKCNAKGPYGPICQLWLDAD